MNDTPHTIERIDDRSPVESPGPMAAREDGAVIIADLEGEGRWLRSDAGVALPEVR